ncbi:unnamed protein product [Ostreobium quekettii]|uniref:tRNA-5-taurinomethyluridine 2-sulfurtransferase n=1 Tax=Ostreobium quekettii TaxID=121088 RepID=A0A8S1J708_9CHLO|nr:unnamed protein product [Ostreobium quekettii]
MTQVFAWQVCARLGVPLEVVPLSKEYWSRVVVRSISQIKRGYTPNPDVLCNSEVKFGAFYDFLEKHSDSFDRIASGHYAGLVRDANQQLVKLAVTTDAIKDQTYFLARLEQQQLAKAMFPLGRLDKSIVRELARIAGLPTQFRKDSQGICFLGKVKFNEFVKEHLGEWPGPLLEEETGQHLGLHKGYWFHTIGQRTGLGLAGGPWYVVRKDIDWNVVFISQNYSALEENRGSFRCTSVNWISGPPEPDKQLYCKVRHGPHSYACELVVDERGHGTVTIHGRDQGLAVGQYAVFYQDMICLGCAVIDWV